MKALFALWVLLLVLGVNEASADEVTQQEYEERLERYDLEAKPESHKNLASWCKRNYPAKYNYHLRAYNELQFSRYEADLPAEPGPNDLKDARDKAGKLGLEDKAAEYHARWGKLQYEIHAKRLKPGDVTMMKQLLIWADKEELNDLQEVRELAEGVIEKEPDTELARGVLGHLKVEGEWKSRMELLEGMDASSVEERIKMHKLLASARNEQEVKYPINPFSGMSQETKGYSFHPKKSPGAKMWIHEKGYSRSKPCRLVIALHGGGSGGTEKSYSHAQTTVSAWASANTREPFVVLCPAATEHVTNSWGTLSNVLEILDAAEEVCGLFNIDRKRIYVTGQSMGGGGTTLWYMCFPEFTAASVGRAGWFHHEARYQMDCMQKPIMIIQGEKDEAFRVESKVKFLETAEKINADLTNISHPDLDHSLFFHLIEDDMFGFFEKHTNDIEPDWDVIRAAARKWMK